MSHDGRVMGNAHTSVPSRQWASLSTHAATSTHSASVASTRSLVDCHSRARHQTKSSRCTSQSLHRLWRGSHTRFQRGSRRQSTSASQRILTADTAARAPSPTQLISRSSMRRRFRRRCVLDTTRRERDGTAIAAHDVGRALGSIMSVVNSNPWMVPLTFLAAGGVSFLPVRDSPPPSSARRLHCGRPPCGVARTGSHPHAGAALRATVHLRSDQPGARSDGRRFRHVDGRATVDGQSLGPGSREWA